MNKWVETAQIAAAAVDAGNGAALVGKFVTVADFTYEFCGLPHMLKVSVSGKGAYLGFRGDLADDGEAWVWAEEGSRPGAKKLVAALCSAYPDLVNGNKFSSFARDFVERFADPNVRLRLPPNQVQAPQGQPVQRPGASVPSVTARTNGLVSSRPATEAAPSPSHSASNDEFSLRTHWGYIVVPLIFVLVKLWPQISSWVQGMH